MWTELAGADIDFLLQIGVGCLFACQRPARAVLLTERLEHACGYMWWHNWWKWLPSKLDNLGHFGQVSSLGDKVHSLLTKPVPAFDTKLVGLFSTVHRQMVKMYFLDCFMVPLEPRELIDFIILLEKPGLSGFLHLVVGTSRCKPKTTPPSSPVWPSMWLFLVAPSFYPSSGPFGPNHLLKRSRPHQFFFCRISSTWRKCHMLMVGNPHYHSCLFTNCVPLFVFDEFQLQNTTVSEGKPSLSPTQFLSPLSVPVASRVLFPPTCWPVAFPFCLDNHPSLPPIFCGRSVPQLFGSVSFLCSTHFSKPGVQNFFLTLVVLRKIIKCTNSDHYPSFK